MRLSELMSSLELWVYPTVGLLSFVGVFAAVAIKAMRTSPDDAAAQGRLPLEDGTTDAGGRR